MKQKIARSLCLLALIFFIAPGAGFSQDKKPAPAPKAPAPQKPAAKPKLPNPQEVLKQNCDFMKKQQQFFFKAEVTNDLVYKGGKKLQFSQDVTASFKRPDKFRIVGNGDLEAKMLTFDGKTLTLYDKDKNHYASMEAPGDMDGALDKAYREYGLRVGLAELGSKKLCERAAHKLAHSLYAGLHRVRGVLCHHLAFDRKDKEFQVWIEAGPKPVLRKIVVTHKNRPGSPQWTAYLYDWNFSPTFSASFFTFVPPAGAQKIKFLPLPKKGEPKAKLKKKGGKS